MRALFALFSRSIREDARARVPTILRATLVAVILLILWGNQADFARHAAPGREFLFMTLFVNLAFLAIATLGSFASAITEEKEDQTLTLLRMTNLSALAILFGKGTSRLFGALLLLAVQIPFTLLAVTLGGVSREQVLQAYAILGAATFFLCNLALLCSVACRTTLRSGVWTGVIGGLLYGLLPVVCFSSALDGMSPGSFTPSTIWQHFSVWVVEANPVYALILLLENQAARGLVARFVMVNVGMGLCFFFLSWLLFDFFCATAGEIITRGKRRAAATPTVATRIIGRPSIRRPLAWKDFHFQIGGWRWLGIRVLICGLLFIGAYAIVRWLDGRSPSSDYFWREVGRGSMVFAIGLFGLELGLLASRIFGDERRALTLSGLVGLPRTTGWLIRQKLLGCLPLLLPSIALFGVGFSLWARRWLINGVWLRSFSAMDGIAIFYIATQAVLLPLVIAFLSLRIRRGAMPAGIAVLTVWNIVTVVFTVVIGGAQEEGTLIFTALFGTLIAVFLIEDIFTGIPRAAAAE